MKKFLPGLCCALLLSTFGPVPNASAHWWPWHHHKNSGSASAAPAPGSKPPKTPKTPKEPKAAKAKKTKHHHHEKAARNDNNGSVVTSPGPRSVGWWHKQPGPAGAGAN